MRFRGRPVRKNTERLVRGEAAVGAALLQYIGLIGSVLVVIEGFVVALSTNGFLITVNAGPCSLQ